ncbi:MAG: hypothetical protein Q4C03_06625, partial [bacterium]|nr:hypothetical protein [bacterium]
MNLFELFIKICVDDQASGKLSKLSSGLGKGLAKAAKIGTAAVTAAAAGISALTTKAVKNYAKYEQLVGGVETLFKDNADLVVEYAEEAYKSAGLSANDYLETVTSFSASLLQSLGGDTAKAADYANQAVVDMADNANKMGTSIEMIQNAYQGFAKQNYTMLDNLKLGYGGTKEEMERLLKEADALSESFNLQVDASGELVYSYADIVDAIHIVQEEMGIAGATAEEAGTTIEGSVNSMRAAWENLVTGISDGNADIDELVNDLVITIAGNGTENNLGVFGNIIPAVENALNGASKVVEKLFPKLIGMLPSILEDTLPSLAKSAMSVVESIIQTISENSDQLSESITGAISSILIHAAENTPDLVGALIELALSLISSLGENLGTIVPALVELIALTIAEIAKNIDNLTGAIFSIIDGIVDVLTSPDGIAKMTAAGFELLVGLITGIITSLPKTAEGIIQLVDTIVGNITETDWEGVGSDLVGEIGEGLKTAWEEIEAAFTTAGETIVSTLEGWGPKLSTFGSEVSEKFEEIKEEAKTLVEDFKAKILESDWYQTGKDMVLEIKDGIAEIAAEAVQWGKD